VKSGYSLRQHEISMRLLLDENLSDHVILLIIDLYPDSLHINALGLVSTGDGIIWEYAKMNGFMILSKDADFHQRSILYGYPSKFIYL
jgi:predicted nuclease of predicted toxin-antitoxin system